MDTVDRKDVEQILVREVYNSLGMDRPVNHDEIVDFIRDDIQATADPVLWHSGDFAIAFRRYLEKDVEH